MKKLKIKFWKAEKALAMQILEQEGLQTYKDDDETKVKITDYPELRSSGEIWLRGDDEDENLKISYEMFKGSQERDEYLDKVVNAITDELFNGSGELKVGEKCEVRNYDNQEWIPKSLLAILPIVYRRRFMIREGLDGLDFYAEARPIFNCTEPKVETNGEIITYTWVEI